MKFQPTQVSLLVSGLFLAAGAHAQSTTDVGTINVQGAPGGTETGQITPEDSPKARSSVTRKAIENQNPVNNPYQVINLLPGVSQFSQDGTGLFGGGLRIRGFNSDQLGFTINGAPVNDSGSFTVFPQEYTDSDNLCEVFVTQGSTDINAPHVGSTGGNVGLVSCRPLETFTPHITQTVGQNALAKTFIKIDSGKVLDGHLKSYIAVSHAETEKFKGVGDAYRDHVEAAADVDLGGGNTITSSFLYNRAVNNNFRAVSKAQIDQQGYYLDYGTIAPRHVAPVNGTAQVDNAAGTYNVVNGIFASGGSASTSGSPTTGNGYYGFNLNPFRNYVATVNAHFNLIPNMTLDVSPYMWYGYGTGGNQLQTLAETVGGTRLAGGGRDYNGDRDQLDTVAAYEGSVTKTYRPGVQANVSYDIAGNHIVLGGWVEKARHQQTAPYVAISDNGTADDIWLRNHDQYLLNADGSAAQFRDWYTISRVRSANLSDTLSLFNDKLTLVAGGRYQVLGRQFTNSPNQGTTPTGIGQTGSGGAPYVIQKDYKSFLPNVGVKYQITDAQSVFFNAARNLKDPPNFAYANLAVSNVSPTAAITFVNGQAVNYRVLEPQVQPEKSYNMDLGYRYATDRITASGSVFFATFKDRIAALVDQTTGQQGQALNVGAANNKGFELEAGYKIAANVNAYSSLSYIKTKMQDNLPLGVGGLFEATKGKEFPDTPKWLAGFLLQYQDEHYVAGVDVKVNGKRYSTLVNDETIPGYALVGLNAAYKFDPFAFAKNSRIQLNVYNLFSRRYLSLNGPSGSNFGVRASPVAGLPTYTAQTYYVGAPRLVSATFSSDF